MPKKINNKLKIAYEKIDKNKFYSMEKAIELAKTTSYTKFDGSIDLAIKLNLDVRKADQQLRGSVLLPNGTGKTIRVLVATEKEVAIKEAKEAGADIIADKEMLTEIIKKEKFDFAVMVADPMMMPLLGKFGRILGPKGLMPNPKMGTVTPNPGKVVTELKKGKANYRTDKNGIIHVMIGKVSFKTSELVENANTILMLLKKLRPTAVKGAYFQTINISPSMGPGIKVKIEV